MMDKEESSANSAEDSWCFWGLRNEVYRVISEKVQLKCMASGI